MSQTADRALRMVLSELGRPHQRIYPLLPTTRAYPWVLVTEGGQVFANGMSAPLDDVMAHTGRITKRRLQNAHRRAQDEWAAFRRRADRLSSAADELQEG